MDELGGSSTVAVAAASTQVFRPRFGKRLAFSISNYGAAVVYVNLSDTETAGANRGIALYPGGTISDSSSDKYMCWQGAVNAYEAGAAGTLACWERCLV